MCCPIKPHVIQQFPLQPYNRLARQEEQLKVLRERLEKVRDDQQKTVQLQIERMREEYMEERALLIKDDFIDHIYGIN